MMIFALITPTGQDLIDFHRPFDFLDLLHQVKVCHKYIVRNLIDVAQNPLLLKQK